jgi:hypothetical protein
MDTQTARTALGVTDTATDADIIKAYTRLTRRYPMQQFPERHQELLEAKDALMQSDRVWQDILFSSQVSLPWLQAHVPSQSNAATDIRWAVGQISRPIIEEYTQEPLDPWSAEPNLDELMAMFGELMRRHQ